MNQDVFEGKWKEMRGQLKEWWGELTDDDLEKRTAKPIKSSACSNRSMATPTRPPKRNSTSGSRM